MDFDPQNYEAKVAQHKQRVKRALRIHSNVIWSQINPFGHHKQDYDQQDEVQIIKNSKCKQQDRLYLDTHFDFTQINKKIQKAILQSANPSTQIIDLSKVQQGQKKVNKCEDFYDCSMLRPVDDDSDESKAPKKGVQKGLRKLAERSFLIMVQLGEATYKEVATRLVDEFRQFPTDQKRQSHEQSNIKRRVYDALNVLIALKVLRKRKRLIVYNASQTSGKAPHRLVNKQKMMNKIQKDKIELEKVVNEKIRQQKFLQATFQKIKRLYARNRDANTRKNRQDAKRLTYGHNSMVMGIMTQKKNLLNNIRFENNKNIFRLTKSPHQIKFFGDMELIKEHSTI